MARSIMLVGQGMPKVQQFPLSLGTAEVQHNIHTRCIYSPTLRIFQT